MRRILSGLLLSVLLTSVASAQSGKSEHREQMLTGSAGFLAAHPDLLYRGRGWQAFKRGDHKEAMRWFVRAARYADKPSQVMIAELLWNGQGRPADRALAYVWMDIAAERGYEGFVSLRELYWHQLEPAERQSALERGQSVYAEYGDPAAKPRIAQVLRRERARMTGSRTGSRSGALWISLVGPDGDEHLIHGTEYYAEKFWDPEAYQAWHDATWQTPRAGSVEIGDLEQMKDAPPQE
ncbi:MULTISPECIES: sel1 repeat family protein [Luteimonas]|nr:MULTISPECIES: sel1 repeat family protein [Luteimonas]